MSEKLIIRLNDAIIMEQEKNVSDFFKYCENRAPKGVWEELTLAKLEDAFAQVEEDLASHVKGKNRWEHILQISKFNPKETEEAYEKMEFYDQHIDEITHTLHIFGMLMDILKLNAAKDIKINIEWTIIE